MDKRLLHYFITIVEKGTMTEASKALHIAQPSLSVAMKSLEREVGFSIFSRQSRQLQLTEQGALLYEEANQLMNHFTYMEQEIERIKHEGAQHMSIGMIESTKYWVPKILRSFVREYPEVQYNIHEILGYKDVIDALRHYAVHFAITNQPVSSRWITSEKIYNEKLVVLLPPEHPATKQKAVSLAQVKHDPLIICEKGFQTREDTLHAFHQLGIRPNIKFEMERFETACSFVEAGLGITIVPENYVRYASFKDFTVKDIQDADLNRSVYIAYLEGRKLSPLVYRLMAMVQDFFKDEEGI